MTFHNTGFLAQLISKVHTASCLWRKKIQHIQHLKHITISISSCLFHLSYQWSDCCFPHFDNITTYEQDQQEHGAIIVKFLAAVGKKAFATVILRTCNFLQTYHSWMWLRNELNPIYSLLVPQYSKSLSRCHRLFSYYPQLIPRVV